VPTTTFPTPDSRAKFPSLLRKEIRRKMPIPGAHLTPPQRTEQMNGRRPARRANLYMKMSRLLASGLPQRKQTSRKCPCGRNSTPALPPPAPTTPNSSSSTPELTNRVHAAVDAPPAPSVYVLSRLPEPPPLPVLPPPPILPVLPPRVESIVGGEKEAPAGSTYADSLGRLDPARPTCAAPSGCSRVRYGAGRETERERGAVVFKEETGGGGGFKKRGEGNGAGRWGQVGPASRCWVVGSVASQGPLRPGSPCCFARRAGQKCLLSNFFLAFSFSLFCSIFLERSFTSETPECGSYHRPFGSGGPRRFRDSTVADDCSYTVQWGLLVWTQRCERDCSLVRGISLAASGSLVWCKLKHDAPGAATCHCNLQPGFSHDAKTMRGTDL
jgi:hypothetical protein